MFLFWLCALLVVIFFGWVGSLFDSSADEGKYKGTLFMTIAAILALSYYFAVSNRIEIPYHAQNEIARSLVNIPDEEQIDHFVFVESENVNIPTDVVCPFVRPVYTQTTNLELLYNISVNSASVNYSNYYINEDNSLYRWMGNRIRKGKINSLPILSICDYKDGATIDVTLYASWERFYIFDIHRTVTLKSTIFVMPRAEDVTYNDWKYACTRKLDSLAKCQSGYITYLSETEASPEYSMYVKPHALQQVTDDEDECHIAQPLPEMERAINLRQDLYLTCNDAPLAVNDVKVSSANGEGIIADIYFEPASQGVITNILFQYYTCSESTGQAYKSDFRHVRIEPGQTHLRLRVEDGYDQFALVGFMEGRPMNMMKDNDAFRFNLSNIVRNAWCFGSIIKINDYSEYYDPITIFLDADNKGLLLVDHRVGFWQKVFYSKYNNSLCWVTTILVGLVIISLLGLAVWLLVRRFKR